MCFRNMFASATAEEGTPEVQMAESTEDLVAILPHCYPIRTLSLYDDWESDKLRSLYEVADKLEIHRAQDAIAFALMIESVFSY